MRALMRRLGNDSELAARALESLNSRDEVESFLPLSKRLGTLKSLGHVPLAQAAQRLLGLARAHSEQQIEGLRAHEWLTMQAGNTGPEGRAVLAHGLTVETDARRRMDLLAAASAARAAAICGSRRTSGDGPSGRFDDFSSFLPRASHSRRATAASSTSCARRNLAPATCETTFNFDSS